MDKQEEMFSMVEEQMASGLSGKAFCRSRGIAATTLYYWKRKKARSRDGGGFITLSVGAVPPRGTVEVRYPNGVRIQVGAGDLGLISQLVRAY